jgi:hypothetical protein
MPKEIAFCKRRPVMRLIGALTGVLVSMSLPAQAQSGYRHNSRPAGAISVAAAPHTPATTVRNGFAELLKGHEAVANGDAIGAERHFREAWQDPSTRPEASDALHRLYRDGRIELTIDEATIRRNLKLLGVNFKRYESEHFVILSDSDRDWIRERGEMLERARTQYFRIAQKMKTPTYPHRTKLLCILFDSHADYQAFARSNDGLEARWVAGYYATASNRVVFYNDASSPAYSAVRSRIQNFEDELRQKRDQADLATRRRQTDRARQLLSSIEELEDRIQRERDRIGKRAAAYSTAKTVHEAIHLLAFNTGLQLGDRDYPFWISEGLATSFETEDANYSFGPDRLPQSSHRRTRYEDLQRQGRLRPLRDLICMTDAPAHDAQAAEAMYSQSYAMFSHLFRVDPPALGGYMSALMSEPSGKISAARHVELFEAYFGSPEAIEARMASGR